MRSIQGIRKLGFKRWFERRLIESHIYLVTCFLCLVLVLAVFEELTSRASAFERVVLFALIAAGSAIGLISWNRYRAILFHALRFSERSVCEKCRAYGRFSVVDSARTIIPGAEEVRGESWLRVKCKNCGYEWTIA